MQLRLSSAVDTPVVAEDDGQIAGQVAGILIHPDTAKIEGFFVRAPGAGRALFLSAADILRWTDRVTVAREEVLSPVEDRVRLRELLEDPRPLLGQRIRTKSGRSLGRCRDVQFDLTHFALTWIFPRRFLRWGVPLPATQILEVRRDAIVVRDQGPATEGSEEPSENLEATSIIPPVPEAA